MTAPVLPAFTAALTAFLISGVMRVRLLLFLVGSALAVPFAAEPFRAALGSSSELSSSFMNSSFDENPYFLWSVPRPLRDFSSWRVSRARVFFAFSTALAS